MASRYEKLQELGRASAKRARSGPPIIRGRDLVWETSHHGKTAHISEPELLGSNVQTMVMFIEELAPGGKNGRHRHFSEALVYILEGRGYSIIDEVRYDWEKGDTLAVPMMAWHQHFNADSENPVQFLAATNQPLLRSMGLFQMEDAEGSGHEAEGHGHGRGGDGHGKGGDGHGHEGHKHG
jgi:gentisate 1,2-dioxygenase